MIKRLIDIFLSRSPNYVRKFILIIVDLILIIISVNVSILFSSTNVSEEFYASLLIISIVIFLITGQYKSITRYLDNKSLLLISLRTLFSLYILSFLGSRFVFSPNNNLIFIFLWIFISLSLTFVRIVFKDLFFLFRSINLKFKKVGIYGAGEAGNQLLTSLKLDKRFKVVYFFDDSKILQGRYINGIPIKNPKNIKRYIHNFEQLFIAIPSLNSNKMRILLNSLPELNMPVLQIPSVEEISSGKASINSLKPISIENILGREIIYPDLELIKKDIENKVVCVTGAGGSIGSEICRQLIKLKPLSIIMIDISEYALYTIHQEISNLNPNIKLSSVLGNMVNLSFLEDLFKKKDINIVFHAAAYKHVPLVEANPLSGIENNVYSTKVLCEEALQAEVDSFTFISTDKAVRPTNVMGASKRLGEQIVQGYAELAKINNLKSKFSLVRFGNVIGSSGSVIPLFKKQIERGGPITITHKDVIRYFMTIKEAVHLVLYSSALSKGGEIFLLDMGKPIKVLTLAKRLIEISGLTIKDKINPKGDISIEFIGLREGEKLYEELLISGKPQTTDHPLIFKAQEKFICLEELKDSLDEMELYLKENKKSLVLKKLKQVVPEWENSNIKISKS